MTTRRTAVLTPLFLLAACVTLPDKMTSTASGNPEVTIAATDIRPIKVRLVAEMAGYGYVVEQDTESSLTLVRPLDSSEVIAASLLVGSRQSTNRRVTTFAFFSGAGGVRIVAIAAFRALIPDGPVKTAYLDNDGNVGNALQQLLLKLKSEIESGVAVGSPKAAPRYL